MQGIARPMFMNVTGYIYFVQMDYIGPIKIGFATYFQNRLRQLQTGSPYKLRLLCLVPGNEQFEKDIHSCFREIRLEGEWFLPHPKLLEEIEQQKFWNKKDGFNHMEPNPAIDIRDNRLNGGNA
jgi:hypothetical protein